MAAPAETAAPRTLSRRQVSILAALAIALGLAANTGFGIANRTGWGIDFNQFYSAAKLVGTGRLYDWDSLRRVEAENGAEVPTGRLPVVLFGHKLLRLFPYKTARVIWMALSLLILAFLGLAWPGVERLRIFPALA